MKDCLFLVGFISIMDWRSSILLFLFNTQKKIVYLFIHYQHKRCFYTWLVHFGEEKKNIFDHHFVHRIFWIDFYDVDLLYDNFHMNSSIIWFTSSRMRFSLFSYSPFIDYVFWQFFSQSQKLKGKLNQEWKHFIIRHERARSILLNYAFLLLFILIIFFVQTKLLDYSHLIPFYLLQYNK